MGNVSFGTFMVSTHWQPRFVGQTATGMRLLALFVGFWMVMLPQMLNARVASTPDEYGSRPAPLTEEEEIKHLDILDLLIAGHEPNDALDRTAWTRYRTERCVMAPHWDVPHPPPWTVVP